MQYYADGLKRRSDSDKGKKREKFPSEIIGYARKCSDDDII